MTDELERLRRNLHRFARPEPAARDAALHAAMQAFDAQHAQQKDLAQGQETGRPDRQADDRQEKPGILQGVIEMFATIATAARRPALLATTSLTVAALAVGIVWLAPAPAPGPTTPLPTIAETEGSSSVPGTVGILAGGGQEPPAPPAERNAEAETLFRLRAIAEQEARDAEAEALFRLGATAEQAERNAEAQTLFALPPTADSAHRVTNFALAEPEVLPPMSADRFDGAPASPIHVTAEDPVSTFSIDVDTASWAWIRSSLEMGVLPDPDSVRIEEMVNYFDYQYPAPAADGPPFGAQVSVFATPWNPGTRLVRIGLQGRMPALEDRPPLDLVFLIDTSGSMDSPDKLPLLKQGFRMMLDQLRPQDRVAIVTYAGSAGLALPPTEAGKRAEILSALDRLSAGGSTAGGEGLRLAYATARSMHEDGRIGRVILATDGDFNVGITDPEEMQREIERQRESGTYLSVLGFGRGNYNDAMMQRLAQNGNGQAAYIDSALEAQRVLVQQLSGALYPIADDVKVQVEFNPAQVAEYRLIGYETRALRREDFNNDRVDAGEIGAGLQVTALYEVVPAGSAARLTDPLRYGTGAQPTQTPGAGANDDRSNELGFLRLRYKLPGEQTSRLIEQPIPATVDEPDTDAAFAAAIAGFGELLRHSHYVGDWTFEDAARLANSARGEDPFGLRAEAVRLIRQAAALSH